MPPLLFDAVFWAAVVCCAVAQLLIVRSTFRSTPATGARRSELAWATLPGIALALVFIFTWREMHPGAPAQPVSVPHGEVAS